MNIDINVNIDVNLFEILKQTYQEDFNRDTNCIGCSELPFCARKICISRLYNIEVPTNMKMLGGKVWHSTIQSPEVLSSFLTMMYQQLGINTSNIRVIPEKEIKTEVLPGKIIEGHIDVFTSYFLLEIKTSHILLKYWSRHVAPFHAFQLNTYLGIEKQILGYILHINLKAFESKIIDTNKVWEKYAYLIPIRFNKDLYNRAIEKAKMMFKMMDKKKFDLSGPEFDWECKTCLKEVKEICGKDIEKERELRELSEMIE
ncbi:MAG: hypothetical protein ACTSQJ_00430 [Promethearchaeota archaeon]